VHDAPDHETYLEAVGGVKAVFALRV